MTKLAAVAANFTRDLEQNYALIEALATDAHEQGVDFMVLPEAAIGGYLSSLGNHGDTVKNTKKSLPPAIRLDGPELARVQSIVGDLTVAIGFCELADDGETRYNAAAVLDGSQIYGTYRKVHQPLGEVGADGPSRVRFHPAMTVHRPDRPQRLAVHPILVVRN